MAEGTEKNKPTLSPIKLHDQNENESDDGSKDASNDVWYTPREIPTSEARIAGNTISKAFFSHALVSVLPEESQGATAQIEEQTDGIEVQNQLEQEKIDETITQEIEQIKSKQPFFDEIVGDVPNEELIEAEVLASAGATPNKTSYYAPNQDTNYGFENPLDQDMAQECPEDQVEDSEF